VIELTTAIKNYHPFECIFGIKVFFQKRKTQGGFFQKRKTQGRRTIFYIKFMTIFRRTKVRLHVITARCNWMIQLQFMNTVFMKTGSQIKYRMTCLTYGKKK